MAQINLFQTAQERLDVWMYKLLLGTLTPEKTGLLKRELQRRNEGDKIFSALERKILAAFTVEQLPTKEYLTILLDDWEKRNWGD